jgi:hypothetical protein
MSNFFKVIEGDPNHAAFEKMFMLGGSLLGFCLCLGFCVKACVLRYTAQRNAQHTREPGISESLSDVEQDIDSTLFNHLTQSPC